MVYRVPLRPHISFKTRINTYIYNVLPHQVEAGELLKQEEISSSDELDSWVDVFVPVVSLQKHITKADNVSNDFWFTIFQQASDGC